MSEAGGPRDFWLSSGYRLLDVNAEGRLAVTPDFLRAYLSRPEMMPPDEACANERALHRRLLDEPRSAVDAADLARLADSDAAENYQVFLRFRDHLVRAGTIEAAYIGLFQSGAPAAPALFVDQLATVILRHLLNEATDAFRLRAAEIFFRTQRCSLEGGGMLLADDEALERLSRRDAPLSLMQIAAEAEGGPRLGIEMDVLTRENAADYWPRSDKHDFVLDFAFTRPGQDAFARVIEVWIVALCGADVEVQPVQRIRDEKWVWHIGMDVASNAIMNALYDGQAVPEAALKQILALFRLEFRDPSLMLARIAGRPVYLGLAMDAAGKLAMKPQNLVVNLPLARLG